MGKGPYSITVAGFNGSGRLGFATANLSDGSVSIFLQHKGVSLVPWLNERRELLKSVKLDSCCIRIAEQFKASASDILAAVRQQQLGGVVGKRKDSLYEAGKRTGSWIKYRVNRGQEFVIGGYIPGPHGFDSLIVGVYQGRERFDVRCSRAIGVTTSLLTDAPGIYFSIGAEDVRRLLRTPQVVITPLPGNIQKEESSSKSLPSSTPDLKEAPPTSKTSLHVDSKPLGASVFVNGIKQSGQTPLDIPLSAGRYNIVPRLPGYVPYSGNVEVKEGGSHLDAKLEQEIIDDISGTYRGTVQNLTAQITANFSIFIRQESKVLFGCMSVQRPLFGSGYLSGTVDGNVVSFLTTAPVFRISFRGSRNGERITGSYTVTSPSVQDGKFELQKSSSKAPPSGFDLSKCPVDPPN